ncbi:Serine/threonine-protein phosphatase 7 long form-like [Vitis vinifera]|uniref:Serine/threonine-protein phosphatase 7 long form-like n=1 Tax=Vitis vinifera TaxID=29760 RepID=A0A438I849_VITVI|nr:Serine/threonine-protein phosphatase 7 long form-like [Vitis vinifera]
MVRNDRTVARMLLVPLKYGMSSVQLFIEQTSNHYHLGNEIGHLTRLSTGNTNVDDENERDEEDDRDDAIDTDEIHLPNDDENCCQTKNIDLVMVQQVVECESTRFVNLEVGDRSNNLEVEFEVENTSLVASPHGTQFNISNDNLEETFVPISYHMPPTPQFLNVDEVINCVVSDWTPWKKPILGNVDGELSIGQIFSSKSDLQHAMKMFSIKAHQEFTVYRSNASVVVLQCKKAPECQWRLRAMTVKDTVAAIQAVVAEQFGYQISYQKTMKAKRKAMTRLFSDWYKSYAELPRFFLALEQSNPGCIMYSKMVPRNNTNEEIFQRVFWAFTPSIKGFAHCRPVLSIDGTHLYGKYKRTLLIAMGCDVAVNETYSGWTQPDACHRFCMRHLASNFNTKFKDKTLKDLMFTSQSGGSMVPAGSLQVKNSLHILTQDKDMDTPLFRARPDLDDTSVLTLQHRHRSSTIHVDPDMSSVLTCRHKMLREWVLDYRVRSYIIQSGFYVFHRDVAILFGLRVHGHPITGFIDIDWHALCEKLLGVRSTETDIRGASLTYSWGSATLTHLYRELCRASLDSAESVAGPLHLLQLWSWERLQVDRPSRSLPHARVPVDERFPPDALGSKTMAIQRQIKRMRNHEEEDHLKEKSFSRPKLFKISLLRVEPKKMAQPVQPVDRLCSSDRRPVEGGQKVSLSLSQWPSLPGQDWNLNRLRFLVIVNELEALGKTYTEVEKVMKILRSLPKKWETKVTAIQEANDLTKLSLEELIGSLMTYEIELYNHQRVEENEKSIDLWL